MIEPLALETWFVNVFAGDINIFSSVLIMMVMGLAGYFRMNGYSLTMVGIMMFILLTGFVSFEIYFILLSITAMLIGYIISKIVKV